MLYCTVVHFVIGKDKLADILNIHPSHAKELMESFLGTFTLASNNNCMRGL